jgi:hypothetical protein
VGPTGLTYDEQADVLYVASTSDNEIFKIEHAEATNVSVPAVVCLCYEELSQWHVGEIASCQATMAEAMH